MIAFATPWAWLALPLAVLPFIAGRRDAHLTGSIQWLPRDRLGDAIELAWKCLAGVAIASIVAGLAGPFTPESRVPYIGRGAEISILLDRSSSMDRVTRNNVPAADGSTTQFSKNDVVRDALARLLAQNPDNRYALTMFNAAPMRIAPFGEDAAIVQAGLDASDIGRGPSDTDMGQALLAAIDAFEDRAYTGSRAVVLVSDGGARLSEQVQRAVAEGLDRLDISLYFVYVSGNINTVDLQLVGTDVDSTREEVALHVFFSGLATDYRVYAAADPESMAEAIAEIDRQQNLPLTSWRRVPHVDHRASCWTLALIATLLLSLLSLLRRDARAVPA